MNFVFYGDEKNIFLLANLLCENNPPMCAFKHKHNHKFCFYILKIGLCLVVLHISKGICRRRILSGVRHANLCRKNKIKICAIFNNLSKYRHKNQLVFAKTV